MDGITNSTVEQTASPVNLSIEHSINSVTPVIYYTGIPICKRFSSQCKLRILKSFASKQRNLVDKVIEKLFISKQGQITLNNRFLLYQYKTCYNAVMDQLYDRKKAEAELQKLMRKRRTVLLPNKQISSNSSLTSEHSVTKFPFLPEPVEEEDDNVASNPASQVPCIAVNSNCISRSCYYWKRVKVLTKEDLDDELDQYMAEIRIKDD